jgi:fumarate hydratase subunit beta
MTEYQIDTARMSEYAGILRAGDQVRLSGVVYTARDAAHKKLLELLARGEPLPFPLAGACIYYAGPTPARDGMPIGSCGPTTSSRMDVMCLPLLRNGLVCMIGKGGRSEEVAQVMRETGSVYLAATGGCGALIASRVKSCEVIAFPELGCESIKRLVVEDFPAVVAMDSVGGSLYGAGACA